MKKIIFLTITALSICSISEAQWSGTNPIFYNGGNVGIGTSNPISRLSVFQSSNTEWAAMIENTGGDGKGMFIKSASGNSIPSLQINDNYDNVRFIVQSNGNVGIGSSNPNYTLTVKGGQSNYQGINIMDANSRLYFDGRRALEGHDSNSRLDIGEGFSRVQLFGNVGIGTTSPSNKLSIRTANALEGIRVESSYGQVAFLGNLGSASNIDRGLLELFDVGTSSIRFAAKSTSDSYIVAGNFGIGTTSPTEKLSVDGTVLAKKVRVSIAGADWPDYVFSPNFKLRSLQELETYIKTNQHLPEVPTAKEVEAQGVDLGSMDATLLKKIEELTLYLIQENKEKEELKRENQELKSVLNTIMERLKKLEERNSN